MWSDYPGPNKPIAGRVRGFADRMVYFDGKGFDLALDALDVAAGRWRLREPVTAIVLAGGRSGRMGRDKGSLVVGGQTLIERVVARLRQHVSEVLVGGLPSSARVVAGTRSVVDRKRGQGPLMGIASCLAASRSDRNLVAACDLPDIPDRLIERLLEEALDCEAAVPRGPGGLEPLLAVYRRRLLPDIERVLAAGEHRIRAAYEGRQVRFVDLTALGIDSLPNLNTPEDLEEYVSRIGLLTDGDSA